jgi:hypothetical protein
VIMLAAMRRAGLLAVVAGCGFSASGPALPDQPPADAAAPDSPGVTLDAGPGADAMRSTFCAIDGAVACYEFEGNARDGSGNGLDATATGVTFVPGGQVGMAMQVDAGSTTNVNASLLFNHVAALTIEAWIKLAHLPAKHQQSDILDVDNQYAFAVNDDGTLTCDLHGLGNFMTSAQVALGRWTHVACTYDGATAGLIYIDGALAANRPGSGQLTTGNNAMSIAANHPTGMQILGLIDQLRLLGVARTAAQICTDAGKTICVTLPL